MGVGEDGRFFSDGIGNLNAHTYISSAGRYQFHLRQSAAPESMGMEFTAHMEREQLISLTNLLAATLGGSLYLPSEDADSEIAP